MGLLHDEQTGNCKGLDIHALCQINRIYILLRQMILNKIGHFKDKISAMSTTLKLAGRSQNAFIDLEPAPKTRAEYICLGQRIHRKVQGPHIGMSCCSTMEKYPFGPLEINDYRG